MRIGTPYFTCERAAVRYYKDYGFTANDVRDKFFAGEIHYGKPPLRDGETLVLIDRATRYGIETR